MNLLLLEAADFVSTEEALIRGRRVVHLQEVLQAQAGDVLRAGVVGGKVGTATLLHQSTEEIRLHVQLQDAPPAPLPVTLLLALPRPIMLKRILQTIATLGVKHLVLMHTSRVEKSFWGSPLLAADAIHEALLLGLEQARDTILPTVQLEQRFKPFMEDRLPALMEGSRALLAHPGGDLACPQNLTTATTLAIGPEGGFIPYEVEKFQAAGFETIHLGQRILRVETAVTVLLAKLF